MATQDSRSPTVSVVITTFNRSDWIGQAIDSALNQTVAPDEIIVVDDGSTDGTQGVLSRYLDRIVAIRLENDGTGQTRPLNVGIRKATSDIIMLLDSDDRLDEKTIAAHLDAYSRARQVGLVSSNWVDEYYDGNRLSYNRFNQAEMVRQNEHAKLSDDIFFISAAVAYPMICQGNFVRSCTGISFPKQVWKSVGGFDQTIRTSTDYNFLFRVLRQYDMVYIDRPLRRLAKHRGNISNASLNRRFRPGLYKDCIALLEREITSAPSLECAKLLRSNRSNWLLELAYHYRENRAYRCSLRTYLTGLRSGDHLLPYMIGIIKLPAGILRNIVARQKIRSSEDS